MSRLLLVSNRLPVTVKRLGTDEIRVEPSAGGLATGLAGPHKQRGGLWLGWPGDVSGLTTAQLAQLDQQLANLRCAPLHLTSTEVKHYYEDFSNGVLWPVFHSMPDSVPLEERHFGTYERVNRRFADAVVKLWRPGDTIWIHDYQLLLVPALVRAQLPDARIGFFLHIPFPPPELFRTLPWATVLLQGLLGADLIGFHTNEFLSDFLASVSELTDGRVTGLHVALPNGRIVNGDVFPMGIDIDAFEALASDERVQAEANAFRTRARERGESLLLGIDRLDYTKGITRRLLAVRRLLARRPELRGHVRLIQIAVPSREKVEAYESLKERVEMLAGRINSQFGTMESVPIHYLSRSCSVEQLVALYLAADVMLVTPLRDGMNLVAKEFAASRLDDDGVLILSRFAGAAAQMNDALLVNPYDIDAMVSALSRALEMPRAERAKRMAALRRNMKNSDVHWWARSFLEKLEGLSRIKPAPALTSSTEGFLLDRLQAASRRILLLDYDGTLFPLVPRPDMAAPDAELLDLLQQLGSQEGSSVHVVSGRPREVLESWLGALPIGLHAEHGLWSRLSPDDKWHRLEHIPTAWMARIRPILEAYAKEPGVIIEVKSASLTWHYRSLPDERGEVLARALQQELAEVLTDSHLNDVLELMPGNKVIEVRPRAVHKGRVVATILAHAEGAPRVAAFGDDRTDEDIFAALPPGALAVHVGPTPSMAPFRLTSPEALRSLLWALLAPVESSVSTDEYELSP